MSQKVTIKDIAKRAGVSVGTVDRVLHNRPNVSKSALEKVKNVLETINYQPNAYASAMATNVIAHSTCCCQRRSPKTIGLKLRKEPCMP